MKIQEIKYINKLPKEFRKNLLKYVVKKTTGSKINRFEKESNIMLRFIASTDSNLAGTTSNELLWTAIINRNRFELITRRYPSSDLEIMHQVLGNKEYQPIKDLFETGDSLKVIDAGANVGFTSIYLKSAFPNAQILCLEIDNNNAAQLKKNIQLNRLEGVTILEKALWKRNAFLEIKRDFRDQTECSYYVEESDSQTGLQGHNLNYYMEEMRWDKVDILKIDIEGAERYLFESDEMADRLLESIRVLAIEIHDEFNIRGTIERHFARHGFAHFNHGDITIAMRK